MGSIGQNLTSLMGMEPLIYHLPTSQWVSNFVVSGPLPVPSSATTSSTQPANTSLPPPSPSPSGTHSSIGAAVGGAVGGIVVVILIGLFIYKRHKRKLLFQGNYNREDKEAQSSQKPPTSWIRSKAMTIDVLNRKDDDDDGGDLYDANYAKRKYNLEDQKDANRALVEKGATTFNPPGKQDNRKYVKRPPPLPTNENLVTRSGSNTSSTAEDGQDGEDVSPPLVHLSSSPSQYGKNTLVSG